MSLVVAAGPVIPNFGQGSACERSNGWFCTDWLYAHWGDTLQPALVQHVWLSALAVGIGFAIAFALALHTVAELELRPAVDGPRVPRSTTLRDALARAIEEHSDTIAVTDEDGRVLGSLTRDDLLR